MPIFEYHCCDCGRDAEVLVRGAEEPRCPECGGGRLEKQLSTFAAVGSEQGGATPERPSCGTCGRPGGPCGSES